MTAGADERSLDESRSAAVIALDGPGGSGKSTIASGLAGRLGWRHLDTGAMYRAVTAVALARQVSLDDPAALTSLADQLELSPALEVGETGVTVGGVVFADELRSDAVTKAVSTVAAVPGVRARLVARQRELIAAADGIVVEGRDIATVVAPEAEVKVYLTARDEVRAARRAGQVGAADAAAVAADLKRRDTADSTRALDPLSQAPGARVLDTSDLTPDEVIDLVLAMRPSASSAPAPLAPATPSPSTPSPSTPAASPVPAPAAPAYSPRLVSLLQAPARVVSRLVWRVRVVGQDNIPASGAVLIVGNHAGALDGPLVVAFSRRHIHILAKVELYHGRLGDFLHRVGQIPVNRGRPDRAALRAARDVLLGGGVLGIFPEGTRGEGTEEMRDVRGGAAYLALHAPCAIVPVVCLGTTDAFPKGARRPVFRAPIMISFGQAFRLTVEGDPRRRSTVAAATEQIRVAMTEHLDGVRNGQQ